MEKTILLVCKDQQNPRLYIHWVIPAEKIAFTLKNSTIISCLTWLGIVTLFLGEPWKGKYECPCLGVEATSKIKIPL